MLRILGIAVLVALGIGGFLVFTGNVDGNVDAQVTNKGRQNYNSGLDKAQEGIEALKAKPQAAAPAKK
jgi:hypothetical protein